MNSYLYLIIKLYVSTLYFAPYECRVDLIKFCKDVLKECCDRDYLIDRLRRRYLLLADTDSVITLKLYDFLTQ